MPTRQQNSFITNLNFILTYTAIWEFHFSILFLTKSFICAVT